MKHAAPFLKKGQKKAKKPPTGPSLFGRIIGFAGLLTCGALIFIFIGLLNYSEKLAAPETQSREILVEIPQGASAKEIAAILKQKGVIRDETAFMRAIRIKGFLKQNTSMKAGEQALDPSKNVWDTIASLVKGNFKHYPFTVPEGYTMADIAHLAEAAGLVKAEDFWAVCHDAEFIRSLDLDAPTLEGYLFPETYNFPKGVSSKDIAKAMVVQFKKVWDRYSAQALSRGLTRTEAVTLASIVEKETGAPEERPLIASVFYNRLEKKMRLQTDPTVIYGIPNFNGNLTKKDLETWTPYNTYMIDGLPPGPIASPGEDAIKAVARPQKSKYLYFVSRNDGTHHFSETLREHNRMVAQYQKGGA
jgi:UPF0755 protein